MVNTMQVAELPLNSRNPFMLGTMMSGVIFRGAAIWQRPFDNGAIAEWSVNGGRQSNNEFLMDGAPNNAQIGRQQHRLCAHRRCRSGVQRAAEFLRRTIWQDRRRRLQRRVEVRRQPASMALSTSSCAAKRSTRIRSRTTPWRIARPAHKPDQYGFQLDGPIYIPKLLKKDGVVRLFYSGAYEGYKELWPQFLRNSFPAAEMRNGDFSRLTTPAGQQVMIFDPYHPQIVNGDPVRAPFAGNMIPASRIHPVARAVTGFMPAPNATTAGLRYASRIAQSRLRRQGRLL